MAAALLGLAWMPSAAADLPQLGTVAEGASSETGCAASSALVGQCFTVHGRLRWQANGRPYLWPAGTNRLLGFPQDLPGMTRWLPAAVDPSAPGNLYERAALPAGALDLYGDFEVCPVTPQKPGNMQMVCMARASSLVARPRP